MFNGFKKAITFSYDDGVTQDRRLIEILNKYGLKGTFNINSDLLGKSTSLIFNGVTVPHDKISVNEVSDIYKNHEVAAHTLTHPLLTKLSEEEIVKQVEKDRIQLSEIVGYEVSGMAYPCGGTNNDDRVAKIIKDNTNIKYARTITSTHSFNLQDNMFRFNPTVYHLDRDDMLSLAEKFIELETNEPKLFYIWGHSYEFDFQDTWDWFEEFCKLISGKPDIFYGTNKEVFDKDL